MTTHDESHDASTAAADGDMAQELLEQAQSNAQAAIIATVAFLLAEDVPLERWTESLGRTFALGWDEPQPWDAGEFMEAMVINLRSLGATILSSDLGAGHAEALTSGFPDPELCALFGVEIDQVARFNDATAVFARERGINWTWEFDGAQTRYAADRADG